MAESPNKEEGGGGLKKAMEEVEEQPSPLKADNDKANNNQESDKEQEIPLPLFHPKQRVYARDTSSGVFYEAIIRRSLFGVNNNPQVVIGLHVSSEQESENAMMDSTSTDQKTWHYFVHYQKWAVNWDRWVSEQDIMDMTDASNQAKAERYTREHKELQQEMKAKSKKKGGKGRINDGTEFLKEWRKRMDRIEEDFQNTKEDEQNNSGEGGAAAKQQEEAAAKDNTQTNTETAATEKSSENIKPKPSKRAKRPAVKKDKWDKDAVEKEYKLRLEGLEGKRTSQQQHKMTLPFSLQKEMVEAWELITTCHMVTDLPAKMTVQKALNQYLESKLSLIVKKDGTTIATADDSDKMEITMDNSAAPDVKSSDTKDKDKSESKEDEEKEKEDEELEKRKQEWRDMTEGIEMFFDEALPFRLLYREELPQYRVVESTFETSCEDPEPEPETTKDDNNKNNESNETMDIDATATTTVLPSEQGQSGNNAVVSNSASETNKNDSEENKAKQQKKRPMMPSEVYGCEHLLRLCLKIPELLEENKPKIESTKGDEDCALAKEALKNYEKESKMVLAKVNDLIRFLHKNQSAMFIENHRKQNEAEQREEQKWIRYVERKRKRAIQEKQEANAASKAEKDLKDSTKAEDANNATGEEQSPPAKKPLTVSGEEVKA